MEVRVNVLNFIAASSRNDITSSTEHQQGHNMDHVVYFIPDGIKCTQYLSC